MRASIGQALIPVNLSPKRQLSQALSSAFIRRGMPIEILSDDIAAASARKEENYRPLFSHFDALIDIRIQSAGYFPAKRAGGFSPTIYVTSQLVIPVGNGLAIEWYGYESDFREADKGESRFFSAPSALSVESLSAIRDRATVIREGMNRIIDLIADQIATDIERAMQKLPKLE